MIQVYHNPAFLIDCLIGKINRIEECVHVANVYSEKLDWAWGLTQNIDNKIWGNEKDIVEALVPVANRRSTAWGDLLIRDGIKYFIGAKGFQVIPEVPVNYFKRLQRDGVYHYYKVTGGPGKTKDGHQEILNFLNDVPQIIFERNFESDPSGLTGTWCQFEVGEPISKNEYELKYKEATSGEFKIVSFTNDK